MIRKEAVINPEDWGIPYKRESMFENLDKGALALICLTILIAFAMASELMYLTMMANKLIN